MTTNLTEDEAASIIQTKYREYRTQSHSSPPSEVNQTGLKELNDDLVTELNKEEEAARCIQRSYRKHLVKQKKASDVKTEEALCTDGIVKAEEQLSEHEESQIKFPKPSIECEPSTSNEELMDKKGDLISSTAKVESGAASTIQYHYKQYKTRMVARKKEQEKAVKVIEKNYIQYKDIKERRKIREGENTAAIKIQRHIRNYQKKSKDKINIKPVVPLEQEKRENAAVTIQRKFRQHQQNKEKLETISNTKISPKLKSLEMRKQERKKLKDNNKIQSDTIQLKTLKKSTSFPVKKVKKTRDIEDLVPREELFEKRREAAESEDEPELANLYDTSTAEVVNCTSSSEGILKTESHNSSPLNPLANPPLSPPLQENYYKSPDVQMITVHGDQTPLMSDYDSYSEEETTPPHKAQTTLVTTSLDGYAVRNLLKKTLPPPSQQCIFQKKAPDSYLQQFLKKMDSPKRDPFRTGRTPKAQALCAKEHQHNQGYHKNFDHLNSRPLPNLGKIAGYGRDAGHVNCNNGYHGYRHIDQNHPPSKGITRGGYYPVIPSYGRLKENEVRKQKNTELQEIPWPTDG